jgi:hypothetical protein
LVGLLNGIQADVMINEQEASELQHWCLLQNEHIKKHPSNEIIPLVKNSLMDGVLSFDEIEDIVYSCNAYLIGSPYYNVVTSGIQVLQGIIHGILSDNNINTKEIQYLKDWLNDNNDLESIYPYDELYSLVHTVLQDGIIDEAEEKLLKAFFADFVDTKVSHNINIGDLDKLKKEMNIQGICALGPNIEISGKQFCFTGSSSRAKRSDIAKIVTNNGGNYHDAVVEKTDFLVVGDGGNPCWVYSCYGRKIYSVTWNTWSPNE